MDLENNWSRLSHIVHQGMRNETVPRAQHALINGRRYANLQEIQYGTVQDNRNGPGLTPLLALYGA
ncbi:MULTISPECIES: hypothetical protein [Streptomyces]|uniref:Tn3 transposase DDE domain-containing protein n=1 Tax=Streptomyces rimosus subsp. rimosus TaxID=132474 RepID=A0ABY3ZFD8_STRRM|nr:MULTISPECIES: hypothetical protein [Streptomyces]KOG69964.1 hypothetical protein ADK78_31100 [Kitasatospora aureofaciens]KOT30737.1 hypothetical protein ADK84_31750 [Streptomyces sp. NRRL WC-3701]KOT55487.1 hypothetical protein ADK45_28870 [Streptomyces rimosus subsp. rimosus]KOT71920.1 hypothetical protein ADK47_30540 [Streptomyces rimosus subsp. rimosus]KOT75393.1 hypothetical protein ADK48_29985 [Streptomyces rimosus subsp. rimosus]